MALVDMKSNLAAGAGKPLGSPEGRHDPNPDLKTSTLDDGSGIPSGAPTGRHDDSDFKKSLTNPGGRHLDGPVEPPTIVPDKKKSKVEKAIALAKTRGMSYILQKVKGFANPATKYLSNEKWGGFIDKITNNMEQVEKKGVLALDSMYDRENTGDYMSNFFTYQSPSGELWPKSSANIGGKLLPQAVLSAVATETNLFLTDCFDNTHAYGFTKNMQSVGSRYLSINGAKMGQDNADTMVVEYSPQNERNRMLSEVGQTVAFANNFINFGGFLKNFTGKMFNSPTKSNYAGVDDKAGTYTPPESVVSITQTKPGYHPASNPYIASTDERYTKQFFVNSSGFQPARGMFLELSNYKGIAGSVGSMTYEAPEEVRQLKYGPGFGNPTSYFSGQPSSADKLKTKTFESKIAKFQTNFTGIEEGKEYTPPKTTLDNVLNWGNPKSTTGTTAPGYLGGAHWITGGGTHPNRWHGFKTSLDNEAHAGFTPSTNLHHADSKKPGTDTPKTNWGDILNLWAGSSVWADNQQIDRVSQLADRGGTEDLRTQTLNSQLTKIWDGKRDLTQQTFNAFGSPATQNNFYSSGFTRYDSSGKEALYNPTFKLVKKDQWWGSEDPNFSLINLTGDDSQDKWDDTGERVLSGPRAMQRGAQRFAEFSKSPQFLIFEGKQLALNALNATSETRVYNPLSIASSFSSLAHIPRHLTPNMTYMGKLGAGSGLAQGFLGAQPGFIIKEGRVEHQSHYQKGTSTPSGKINMKKVDPNRYTGAFEGVNKLKLLGAQAMTRMGLSEDKMLYSQDVTITKDGVKYENHMTPKNPYLQKFQSGASMDEKTLADGKGMPQRQLVSIDNKFTFSRDGKQDKNSKKSAIEKMYLKFQTSPSSVSQGHSGIGTKGKGVVKEKDYKSDKGKHYDTMNVLKKSFKPTNDGSPHMPEGGYEKEGLFKGVSENLQPGKYKTNMRIDGGRGFASSAAPGTSKKDMYKSGKADSRGNETKDEVNVIPYDKPGKTPWENKDFVPFKFLDKYNNKQIVFRAAFKSITESVTPDWNSIDYIGRPDKLHVYKGAERDLNINFTIYPYTYKEFKVLWAKFNYLSGLTMPSYEKITGGGERMVPPMIELSVGDLYTKMPGYIKTMTHTFGVNNGWEIKTGERLPKYIDITLDFMVIGKKQWKRDGDLYGFNAKKFNKA